MKPKRLILLFLATTLAPAGAFDYAAAPERSYFASSLWRNRDRVVVPKEGLELTEDTYLKVDELILDGPIASNGHSLHIDALQITFHPNGAIVGFTAPALEGRARVEGAQGKRSTAESGMGGFGETPPAADNGVDGVAHPAAIVIYGSRVVGPVIVDASGQKGGKGGHGGRGGKGGTGGAGRNGDAECGQFIFGKNNATDGGQGGQGAPGGDGGIGGQGGAPVPLVFVTGQPLAADAKIAQAPGAVGDPGDPGDPGLPGDGGPGGNGDSTGCGLWRESVDGGDPGPQGPTQTQAGHPGSPGRAAPALDPTTEPQPTFAGLAKDSGPIVANLVGLEDSRAQLVEAWSTFHWARTFLFLTLDTLSEVQNEQSENAPDINGFRAGDQSDLTQGLLNNVNHDRLATLVQLWSGNLVEPLNALHLEKDSPLFGAPAAAGTVIELLSKLQSGQLPPTQLPALLETVRSSAEAQLQASLNNALESCKAYTALKQLVLAPVLTLTPTYAIPVCEGNPDFRVAANLDRPIEFFYPGHSSVPDAIKNVYKQLAYFLKVVSPIAYAEGFSVVDTSNTAADGDEIQKHLPARGVWVVEGVGVFSGFPAVTRVRGVGEIGQQLFVLQQNFKRMLNR